MLNQIILIGRVKELKERENKKEIFIEVERPFKENSMKEVDIFKCLAWTSIFNKILNLCSLGDLLAIKGRLINDNDEYIVISENISLLNKSKNNISKTANI